MVLAVVDESSASNNLKNKNQSYFNSDRIVSTQVAQNIAVADGTCVRGRNQNRHHGRKNCRKFSDVLNGEAIQWKLNQRRSQCAVKSLRKFSEFNGHLIKMRLQWFLLCLFLFCTHATTLARPNANNDNSHETSQLAADVVYFDSNVSPANFSTLNSNSNRGKNYFPWAKPGI